MTFFHSASFVPFVIPYPSYFVDHLPKTITNTYKNIPVEVTGIPYEFKDICGNHTIDYVMDYEYTLISTGQSSKFVNFKINKFVFDFKSDGSLVLSTVSSYDQTPAGGNRFYPANSNAVHEWNLQPKYHQHLEGDCSLDRYDDIAVSQAKLNEMKKDPALKKVYDILDLFNNLEYSINCKWAGERRGKTPKRFSLSGCTE